MTDEVGGDEEWSEKWTFRLGQCISHKEQSMPSVVLGRYRTTKGLEIYAVRSFALVDPERDRLILGESLVNVTLGSAPCQDCLLHRTTMCPSVEQPALMAAE